MNIIHTGPTVRMKVFGKELLVLALSLALVYNVLYAHFTVTVFDS